MTILHLSAGNLFGGVERIVVECARSRALESSIDPAFAVCFEGRLARQIRDTGLDCAVLGDVRVSRPHTVVRTRKRLSELIDRVRPDAVICHSCWVYGLAAPVLARRGAIAVPWIHDRLSGATWVERWASLSNPSLVICNSRYTEASASKVFPRALTSVVYAPVAPSSSPDPVDRRTLRDEVGAASDTCVVLIASRFESWKGHRELIAALASIPSGWQLWVAGEPQKTAERANAGELRALAETKGVEDRVRFLGHRDDVRTLMSAADVLCQPNTAPEPFGITFVEALYAGLPVVTTAAGGALEIVTDACGILVPPGDGRALAGALGSLVFDVNKRRNLAQAGPTRASALCDPAARLSELSTVLTGSGVTCH